MIDWKGTVVFPFRTKVLAMLIIHRIWSAVGNAMTNKCIHNKICELKTNFIKILAVGYVIPQSLSTPNLADHLYSNITGSM